MPDEPEEEDDGPEEEEPLSRTVSIGVKLKAPPKEVDEIGAAAATVKLVLSFQGEEWANDFEPEKTVEFVKALALEKFGALQNHKDLDLKQDGTSLMDPMSLVDYPQMQAGSTVRLECSAEPQ